MTSLRKKTMARKRKERQLYTTTPKTERYEMPTAMR
jgi:hypothetical protein